MKNTRARNQRVSSTRQRQKHVLDVTVRHDKAVAQRYRAIIGFTCKSILVVGFVVGSYLGGKEGLRRYLWENPDYYLSDIRISTDGSLTREQILTAGAIVPGINIFKIDLAKARAALSELPQAERVEIQRVLPNRFNITVTERRPIAWVSAKADEDPATSDKSFLIDARGVVMRSKTVLPEYLHLPVILGVEVANLAPGQRVQSIEMQSALDLVRLNSDSTRFQVRKIDLSKGYCLKVIDRNQSRITFGLDRVDLQLERLNRLLDHLDQGHQQLQTVNLLVERNTPVTFMPAGGAEEEAAVELPPKPETVKPPVAKSSTPAPAAKSSGSANKPSTPAVRKATAVESNGGGSKPKATPVKSPARTTPVDGIRKPFRLNG